MKSELEMQNGGAVASKDGLGVNRVGDTILCYAWGETDRPNAMLAKSKEEVRRFIVLEWIDDDKDPMVQEIMDELAAHDWREDGELRYEFEIGGCTFEDVVTVTPNAEVSGRRADDSRLQPGREPAVRSTDGL